MVTALSGRFFAKHNKKSLGQNSYHWSISPDENNSRDRRDVTALATQVNK